MKYSDYAVVGLSALFVILFSAELKVFSLKQPNYPFRLLF